MFDKLRSFFKKKKEEPKKLQNEKIDQEFEVFCRFYNFSGKLNF